MGPTFSNSSLNEFEPTAKRMCVEFVESLDRAAIQNEGVIDISEWFNLFAFDVHLFQWFNSRLQERCSSRKISAVSKGESNTFILLQCTRYWF